MRGNVGHIEFGEQFLGRLRVVVRGSPDQGKACQRHQRVDAGFIALHEEALDGRPGIEAAGERRDDAQAPRFEILDYGVVVA